MNPSELVDRLARLAQHASDEAPPVRDCAGLERLERALVERQDRRRRLPRWALLGLVPVAAAAALLVVLHDRALTFQVMNGRMSGAGYVVSDAANARVEFSDRSELGLEPRTRLRISGLDVHGAHVMLEGGLLHVNIQPRPKGSWAIDAGPYVVRVTGTEFDVAWDVDRQTLDLHLYHGHVVVESTLVAGSIAMEAGQHLVANAKDASLSLETLREEASVAPGRAGAPAAQTVGTAAANLPPAPVDTPPASTSAAPRSASSAPPTWGARVVRGDFEGVVDEAEHRGVDRSLAEAPLGDLAALADAARYARRPDLARRALQSERARFASSVQARDAAFFLGGLAEGGDDAGALAWYETYLRESGSGAYASQALGRKMMIVQRTRGNADARPLAEEYLRRFHDGPYAASARKLLQLP